MGNHPSNTPDNDQDETRPPRGPLAFAVHGGAWQIPDDEAEAHNGGMRAALTLGRRVLETGGSALDAVTEAIVLLEEDPTFDAGIGSVLNTAGQVEMDASIMDGTGLRAGAAACVREVQSPVRLARALLERGRHVFLSGEGAHEAARLLGLPMADPASFVLERERRRLAAILGDDRFRIPDPFDHPEAREEPGFLPRLCYGGGGGAPAGREIDGGTAGRETDGRQASTGEGIADATSHAELGGSTQLPRDVAHPTGPAPGGTVGAVARDRQGRLAAATSTGGAPGKWPGRIGDSPVIGAGTFADDEAGACSATGWGESILRAGLASDAVRRLRANLDRNAEGRDFGPPLHPSLAARAAILWFQRRVGGLGGVILLDRRGRVGWAFNTPRMSRGVWVEGQGEAIIGLDP
jgi:beta-aspartyl-peptidase (threonine type)